MIITQQSPLEFAPVVTITPETVQTSLSSEVSITNSGVVFDKTITSSFYRNHRISGSGLNGGYISYSSELLDSSEFPLIKRLAPSYGVGIKVSNGRAETKTLYVDFSNVAGLTSFSAPKSIVNNTYAKYSWDRVYQIFSQLDDGTPENHKVLDPNHQRRLTSIIPHDSLTCHQDNINEVGGHLRGIAITPRHVLGIAHSGGATTGYTVRFRDINGNAIDRTVVRNVNVSLEFPNASFPSDVRLLVLNSDLPTSITPALYLGDWFYRYTGTKTSGTYNPGAFGFIAFNQDTHIVPVQAVNPVPFPHASTASLSLASAVLSGTDFGNFSVSNITLQGYESWNYIGPNNILGQWYPEQPFYHKIRAGDSGSPIFFPVANNKWAIGYGIVSGAMWRPEAINALIKYANDSFGIAQTYTVTVADEPSY